MAQAELRAIAKLDGKGFEAGVDKIGKKTDTFASKLNGLKGIIAGAFTIGAAVRFGKTMLQVADDLNTTAQTVGITMESMLGLKTAMAESGIKAEEMLRIMSRLKIAQGEVISGNKTYRDAVEQLGMTWEEFVSLPVDKLLEKIGAKYVAAGGAAKEFNAVSEIFGQQLGPQMIEVLERINREGLKKFTDESKAAASGMLSIAEASDKIEAVWNKIIIAVGKGIGLLEQAAEATFQAFGGKDITRGFRATAEGQKQWGDTGKWVDVEEPGPTNEQRNVEALRDQLAKDEEERQKKLVKAQEDADRKRVESAQKAADKIATLKEKQEDLIKKGYEVEDKFAERRAELAAGRGIAAPAMAQVDELQRIGGIVGGVSGAGSQEARIAERSAAALEESLKLEKERMATMREIGIDLKLIAKEIQELGGG